MARPTKLSVTAEPRVARRARPGARELGGLACPAAGANPSAVVWRSQRRSVLLLVLAVGGCAREPASASGMVVVRSGSGVAVTAYFVDVPLHALERDELDGCVVTLTSGACQLVACNETGPPSSRSSAGVVEVIIDGSPLLTATPPSGEDFAYGSTLPGSSPVPFGTSLTVVATGSDVPAFAVDVVQPQLLRTSRAESPSTSRGWLARWTPTLAAEEVWVSLTPRAGGRRVACHVPSGAGSVEIDAVLIDALGAVGSQVDLSIASVNRVVVGTGGYDVGVYAMAGGDARLTIVE